jgi:glycosyltransferase involved in cell wall biosynthesis
VIRIVSLTPSRVIRDSRTFKEATSFAHHGIDSVVVEGQPSGTDLGHVPFSVHDVPGPAVAGLEFDVDERAVADHETRASGHPIVRLWRRVPRPARRAAERALRVPLTIGAYLAAAHRKATELPEADLYWLHGYAQLPQAWLAARRAKAPIVYDAHDFYPQVIEGGEGTRLERLVMRAFYLAVERVCHIVAAEVVTVSDGVADLIAARTGRRPLLIRNCAELREMAEGGPDVRSACGLGPDDFVVVMPGNHKAGMRAIPEAIGAFATLPERAHLALIGDGYAAFADQVNELGLDRRVHLLPAVPADQVPVFIRSADAAAVLYMPTMSAIEFALPNGLFAAIAAGLPLLWPPRLPEIRRLAERYEFGVPVEPSDSASVAAGVHELLADRERYETLRANVERARSELNWEVEERRLLEVVARLTGRR